MSKPMMCFCAGYGFEQGGDFVPAHATGLRRAYGCHERRVEDVEIDADVDVIGQAAQRP